MRIMNKEDILNRRQKQVLAYIREFLHDRGYPPSVREIGAAVGLSSSSTVHMYLNQLAERGFIKRDPSKPRAIDVLDESPWRQKKLMPVPLVGKVTAGLPITAIENVDDTFPLPADLVGVDDTFMLTVQGDSMIEAGILDGDYIVVRVQQTARNGEIIVALVDDEEATVKRYYKEKNGFRLQPENPAYEPIHSTNVKVLGKVIGLIRLM